MTELERIMAEAVDTAEDRLDANRDAMADLRRLLAAGQKPYVLKPCGGYEMFLEFRRPG